MPHSYGFFDEQISEFVRRLRPSRILDVGPGAGKYGAMFHGVFPIEACEVHAPYVSKFDLGAKYDLVHVADIRTFSVKGYDLVIMGDVLEHLAYGDAQGILARVECPVLVVVPYQYEQGECEGNAHEAHLQPELTEALFLARYKGFRKIFGNDKQGVFFSEPRKTIGVGLICKNEAQDIRRCLDSVVPFADMIAVFDTGSTDATLDIIDQFAKENPAIPVHVETYLRASEQDANGEWVLWDFSKARNQYLSYLADKCDWIFTIDADDEVLDPELVNGLRDSSATAFFVDLIMSPVYKFAQYKMWPARHGVRFAGPVHEHPNLAGLTLSESKVRVQHRSEVVFTQEQGDCRNYRILMREYTEGRRTPRTLYYLATTMKDLCRFHEAVPVYDEYLASGDDFHDQVIWAHINKSRCLRFLKKPLQALGVAFSGLALDQRWSELWMEAAYAYQEMGAKAKAIAMATAAIQPMHKTMLFQEQDKYRDEPCRLISSL